MFKYMAGFIGSGHMGGALASAVARAVPSDRVALTSKSGRTAARVAMQIGAAPTSLEDIVLNSHWIFFAVKPQTLPELLPQVAELLKRRSEMSGPYVLVSMAAGVTTASICEMLGMADAPVIRIMPNTPVAVGNGMTVYSPSEAVSREDVAEFCGMMAYAGMIDMIDEKLMDAACAVSGCGPAFVYSFIKALAEAGEQCGLPKNKAVQYAVQTTIGSALLLRESGADPDDLIDAVCSPGGSTIEGVKVLREEAWEETLHAAVGASYKRNIELGEH